MKRIKLDPKLNFKQMHKYMLSIFLILFVATNSYCQTKTKLISREWNGHFEEFEILSSMKRVKHGSYIKFNKFRPLVTLEDKNFGEFSNQIQLLEVGSFDNGKKSGLWKYYYEDVPFNTLKEEGTFDNDQKHGHWTTYWMDTVQNDISYIEHSDDKNTDSLNIIVTQTNSRLKSRGNYSFDKKTGIWEYHNFKGILVQKYDHSEGTFVFLNDQNDEFLAQQQHGAEFIGGFEHFEQFILDNISTIKFGDKPRSESVKFDVKIDEHGAVQEIIQLVKNDNVSNLDKQIMKALKLTSLQWIPEKIEGKYVPSNLTIYANMDVKWTKGSLFYQHSVKLNIDR